MNVENVFSWGQLYGSVELATINPPEASETQFILGKTGFLGKAALCKLN